ncbi:class I SAM-dependent methyltransferase [Pseudalkalibacillus sp. SCS-8]|uniref:class I SAM-dependent methyltransferase n=1 Tax=Pseudalkalibacillus nanhaiensis TaxID=3115291 RepID=UPI0032DBE77A
MDQQSHIRMFDKQAKKYERMQRKDPTRRFRRKIIPYASGSILEVAIGTGLNLPHYQNVTELVGIDFSPEMLKGARKMADYSPFPVNLKQADVETIEFEAGSFDTVVSTLSFCSYNNPVDLLNRFQKWCKPNGQILLMEHGVSSVKTIAWLQKQVDPLAFRLIGCHQDRDIQGYLAESNLKCEKVERALAGALYYIWAKP